MSPRGWLQQINRLPSAGGSTGSGRKDGQDGLPGKLFIEGFEDGWRAERQIRGVFDDGPGNQTSLAVMTNAGAARDPHETPVVGLVEDVEHRTALLGIVIEDAMQVVGREGVGQGLRAFPVAIRSTAILRGLRQAAGF